MLRHQVEQPVVDAALTRKGLVQRPAHLLRGWDRGVRMLHRLVLIGPLALLGAGLLLRLLLGTLGVGAFLGLALLLLVPILELVVLEVEVRFVERIGQLTARQRLVIEIVVTRDVGMDQLVVGHAARRCAARMRACGTSTE